MKKIYVLALGLLLVISFPLQFPISHAQTDFSTPINLSNDVAQARSPNLFNYQNHVYVAWTEGSRGIFFRESPDGGVTWVPPVASTALKISNPGGVAQYPMLSANGTNVYITWSQTVGSTGLQLFEATSTDYGASFSAARQITSGTVDGGHITPVIASWGSTVYLAYKAGNFNYVIVSSNDAGATWGTPFAIGSREPQLAVWGSNAYIATVGGAAYSNNGGATWTRVRVLGCCGSEPWVWASGSNAYITWQTKTSASRVYVTATNDNGRTWTPALYLSSTLPNSWQPMLWAVGNSAWIATHTNPGGSGSQVYVYTTTNAGRNWNAPVSLSGPLGTGTTTSFPFTVASSDGVNVFVAWSQQVSPGYWVFRVSYSGDGGITWSPAPGINVSHNTSGRAGDGTDVANGAILSYGTHCFAAWQYISGTTSQIYFSHS